jgi:hypothetical protein
MKRSLPRLVLLALAAASCRSAGPKGPPPAAGPAPDVVAPYVGQIRILRHKGDERTLTVRVGERFGGDCDLAVRVRTAIFDRGTARFSLLTVGLPNVAGRGSVCREVYAGTQLAVSGFPAAPAASEVAARLDELLQTPEAFLRAKGQAFDLPPGKTPAQVASQDPVAKSEERVLASKVTAWPKLLLSVDARASDITGRVRHQGEVEFDALVGDDGRLHEPKVRTPLSEAHQDAVLAALSLWRYEPARRGDERVGARIRGRLVLRID